MSKRKTPHSKAAPKPEPVDEPFTRKVNFASTASLDDGLLRFRIAITRGGRMPSESDAVRQLLDFAIKGHPLMEQK